MADALVDAIQGCSDQELLDALVTSLEERHDVLEGLVEWAAGAIYFPSSVLTNHRYTGRIKSFSAKNGYGFIDCPEVKAAFGSDVFLHGNKMTFEVGSEVNFAALLNKDKKLRAFDLIAGRPEHNGSASAAGQGEPVRNQALQAGSAAGRLPTPPPPPRATPYASGFSESSFKGGGKATQVQRPEGHFHNPSM